MQGRFGGALATARGGRCGLVGPDTGEQLVRRLIARVLRHQLPPKRFGKNGLMEPKYAMPAEAPAPAVASAPVKAEREPGQPCARPAIRTC